MELAQLSFDQISEARFQMIGIDRKIGTADFSEFSLHEFRCEMFRRLGNRPMGIGVGDFNKGRFQARHGRRGSPEIFCLIRVSTVQDGGVIIADQESDCRNKMVDPDRYDAQTGRHPLAIEPQFL